MNHEVRILTVSLAISALFVLAACNGTETNVSAASLVKNPAIETLKKTDDEAVQELTGSILLTKNSDQPTNESWKIDRGEIGENISSSVALLKRRVNTAKNGSDLWEFVANRLAGTEVRVNDTRGNEYVGYRVIYVQNKEATGHEIGHELGNINPDNPLDETQRDKAMVLSETFAETVRADSGKNFDDTTSKCGTNRSPKHLDYRKGASFLMHQGLKLWTAWLNGYRKFYTHPLVINPLDQATRPTLDEMVKYIAEDLDQSPEEVASTLNEVYEQACN